MCPGLSIEVPELLHLELLIWNTLFTHNLDMICVSPFKFIGAVCACMGYTENSCLGALQKYLQNEWTLLHRQTWFWGHVLTQFTHVHYGCLTLCLGTTTAVTREQSVHSLFCHFLPPTLLLLCPSPALFSLTAVWLLNSPLVWLREREWERGLLRTAKPAFQSSLYQQITCQIASPSPTQSLPFPFRSPLLWCPALVLVWLQMKWKAAEELGHQPSDSQMN